MKTPMKKPSASRRPPGSAPAASRTNQRRPPAPPNVRGEAVRILARVDGEGGYADILIDHALRGGSFPDLRDRALLTELVMGTLRRRGTLDTALAAHLSRPLEKTDVAVRNALRLAVYQLLYTRVPERVALFETVEAVKSLRGEQVAGFANAVLRAFLRDGRKVRLPESPWAAKVAADCSAPVSLVNALAQSLGFAPTVEFLAAALEKPPFTVRVNPFRGGREALFERFARDGREPAACRYAPEGIVLAHPGAVHSDADFGEGRYLVMDEGAQLVAPLLSPRAGEEILDACAAPGGKSTHLSALSGGKALVTAVDVSESRVAMLRDTVTRLGAPGVEARVHDFSAVPLRGLTGRFDKALVDAPCSGMGVIRRNPDAKWRFTPDDAPRMAELQRAILRNVWPSLKSGGLLLYCTCSPLREEDEEVVAAFVSETRATRVDRAEILASRWPGPADAVADDGSIRLHPHRHGTDGFFAALLRKVR
jgi:16S rRNA (cytosine967-C5)-methyltransferase